MATIATALTQYADNGNSRTYSAPGHTAVAPFLVIQKRVAPSAPGSSQEVSVRVVKATKDAEGLPVAARDSAEIIFRQPSNGLAADKTAVLALIREIVASDEFGAAVDTLNWIKP